MFSTLRWVEYLLHSGIDFVFIDTEHIPLDRSQVSWMCQLFSQAEIAPIVRISAPDPYLACMALDGGAAGIVAPYLEDLEQILDLRGAVHYRPLKGKKLAGVLNGSITLSKEEESYLKEYNKDRLMIINCESSYGISQLDKMLKIPGVDAVFIGPHDLSINLGIPECYKSPVFQEAVHKIISICNDNKISVGNHFSVSLEQQIEWVRAGMNIVLWNIDALRFIQALREDFETLRKALGEREKSDLGQVGTLEI